MKAIANLAKSRVRHNRNQTILTGIAFILTACLLMAVSTIGLGIYRFEKSQALNSNRNYHALFSEVSPEQLEALKLHLDVEALSATEIYADVVYEKMNASLCQEQVLIPGVRSAAIVEGRLPETPEEIAGPPAFFQRLGLENPALGDVVTIDFRPQGKGEITQRPFVISGFHEQVDLSEYSIADTRIVYSALISKALADETLAEAQRTYRVSLRVSGEDHLNSVEMEEKINNLARDIGLSEDNVRINDGYLMWVTDPGSEVIAAVAGISLLIVLFAALVIYGIYHVSIITNVQELGKLKALGATKGQMRRLLLEEGLLVALCGLPIGLLLGHLIARGCMAFLFNYFLPGGSGAEVSLFSLPILLIVIAVVLITAILAMLRPMTLAAKISPMEALRYQEETAAKDAKRKGYTFLNIPRLSRANMGRNRRRTAITIVTMSLGGILFLSLGSIASSMSPLDSVRHHMPKGDFVVELRYETNDLTYPENNLNALQTQGIMGDSLVQEVSAIPGVSRVETIPTVMAAVHHPSYDANKRYTVSTFTREDCDILDVRQGVVNYDEMLNNGSILVSYNIIMENYGLQLGDTIPLTLYDGNREVPFTATIVAATQVWGGDFAIPDELMGQLITDTNPTESLVVWTEGGVEGEAYPGVKASLTEMVDANNRLALMSLDEELALAKKSMDSIRLALYLLIATLGIISFLSLINTLVTGVITRRREIGTLQALGLSNKQLRQMLWQESLFFTGGTLLFSLTLGNLLGYLGFLWSKSSGLMGILHYHYPLTETLIMTALLFLGQFLMIVLLIRYIHKDSLVQRVQA